MSMVRYAGLVACFLWSAGTAYATLQGDIDAASPGDTINVLPGTYAPVTIDKPLTLVGAPDLGSTVDCSLTGQDTGIIIDADNVVVQGFSVQYCSLAGILVEGHRDCTIQDNKLLQNGHGLRVTSCNRMSILSNRMVDNTVFGLGIYGYELHQGWYLDHHVDDGNIVELTGAVTTETGSERIHYYHCGFRSLPPHDPADDQWTLPHVFNMAKIAVMECGTVDYEIKDKTIRDRGILTRNTNLTIKNNEITDSWSYLRSGIWIQYGTSWIEGNTITECGHGIHSMYASPTIVGNLIYDNDEAIRLFYGGSWVEGNQLLNNGNGIDAPDAYSPKIISNVITARTAGAGDGIWQHTWSTNYHYTVNAVIERNDISGFEYGIKRRHTLGGRINDNNILDNEYGIHFQSSAASIYQNRITDNALSGLYLYSDSGSDIFNNVIGWNDEGIHCADTSAPAVTNNIIVSMTTGGITCPDGAMPGIEHNDLWNNGSYDVSGCGVPGVTNIFEDPLFVNPTWGDYHLRFDSPCIDTGSNDVPGLPMYDRDGNPRIADGDDDGVAIVDMGMYEVVGLGTVTGEISEQIEDLVESGDLPIGTGKRLQGLLEAIAGAGNPQAACRALDRFVKEVKKGMADGTIPEEVGQGWLDEAAAIGEQLGCPPTI